MSDDAPNAAAAASGEADADDFDILPTQMPPRFAQRHAQAGAGARGRGVPDAGLELTLAPRRGGMALPEMRTRSGDTLSIGRAAGCFLRLPDSLGSAGVSRMHATVKWDTVNEQWVLRCTGATELNHERLEAEVDVALEPNDVLSFGDVEYNVILPHALRGYEAHYAQTAESLLTEAQRDIHGGRTSADFDAIWRSIGRLISGLRRAREVHDACAETIGRRRDGAAQTHARRTAHAANHHPGFGMAGARRRRDGGGPEATVQLTMRVCNSVISL